MQWSKIRSRLLELVAPSVRRRVDFHLTNYRDHSDHAHEVWITVDQKRIFSASYCRNMIEEDVVSRRTGLPTWGDGPESKNAADILTMREVHDAADIILSFRTYLDLNPQIALTSTDPILRGLAMLDKRIGKRTRKAIEVADSEHSLIKNLYLLRMENPDDPVLNRPSSAM